MAALLPGTEITPAIRLIRPLRRGGMGSVWVAEHTGLSTEVAVKFLSPNLVEDAESVARFRREASAASQVKSPHVVQMLDHGVTDDGVPFLVMELLEGSTLTDRLRDGPLPVPTAVKIATQLARALGKAHEKGIVHRDIKPDNIFLCDVGGEEVFAKLLDFGVAKAPKSATEASHSITGAMVGTPHYMSPEQAVGSGDLDHRTDLWSLGMVVYEMLTGHRPFASDTIGGIVLELHTATIRPPCSLNPDLPPGIDAWFARASAKDPNLRFSSARQLSDTLVDAARVRSSMVPDPRPSSEVATIAASLRDRKTVREVPLPPPVLPEIVPPSLRPPPARSTSSSPEAEEWRDRVDRSNQLRAPDAGSRRRTRAASGDDPDLELAPDPGAPSSRPSAPGAALRGEEPSPSPWKLLIGAFVVVLLIAAALRARDLFQ